MSWVCNECGSEEFAFSVSEDDMEHMSCTNCGGTEFHWVEDAAGQHDYLSTACHHGQHDRCRKECKFCAVPCKCACHS